MNAATTIEVNRLSEKGIENNLRVIAVELRNPATLDDRRDALIAIADALLDELHRRRAPRIPA